MATFKVLQGDCLELLNRNSIEREIDLTFLDPPFNQSKEYEFFDDDLPDEKYWQFMIEVCSKVFTLTSAGGCIYFMQREKNTENVLKCLRESGWTFQNLIVWKKKTSAVPQAVRFGKQFQIIAFATKGERTRVFNRLRIDPPLPANYKVERENGTYVTDVWDDIREMTSGYLAGDEAIRNEVGERFHKQQSPIALLLRIMLSSTKVGDTVLDPFSGTGTTSVVAHQLNRNSIAIEIDPKNAKCIQERLATLRDSDQVEKYYKEYACTIGLEEIWGAKVATIDRKKKTKNLELFADK
jgi:DNA modification methylase